jgi:flavin-binding protein dodecin
MDDHVYKIIELVGTSTNSIEEAVNNAIERAGVTLKNLRWFTVTETRGEIAANHVAHWQVTIKLGFTIEDRA